MANRTKTRMRKSSSRKTTKKATRKATKKKASRRKASRRRAATARSRALSQLEQRVPTRFGDYLAQLQRRLDGLEKQIAGAQDTAMQRATRLLKDASRQLGRFEAARERGWQQLSLRYRTEAVKLLRRLEAAIAPPNSAIGRRVQRPRRKA